MESITVKNAIAQMFIHDNSELIQSDNEKSSLSRFLMHI